MTQSPSSSNTPTPPHASTADAQDYRQAPRAGLWRRLGAILYDGMTLIAILMFAMALAVGAVSALAAIGLISLQGYVDTAAYVQAHAIWFQLYMLAVVLWFYLYFWLKGGQTLGMRAWRLLLVQIDGNAITLRQGLIRLATALAGLGTLWILVRYKQKQTLQCQLSNTQVVLLTKAQSEALNLHKTAR